MSKPKAPKAAHKGKPGGKAGRPQRPSKNPRPHGPKTAGDAAAGKLLLYGKHPVMAALQNPQRRIDRLMGAASALESLDRFPKGVPVQNVEPRLLDQMVGRDAVHQGLVLSVAPLESPFLEDVLKTAGGAPLLALDQVTDPHNVGAILRSAAAFGAAAVISQDRHSPPESGALAKAASGALEAVPWVRVVNLARALEQIAEAGYWRIGLDGGAAATLAEALAPRPTCLVLGAEGKGLRPNSAAHCDILAKLPISRRVESLNVSNAAAVALYAVNASQG